MVWDWLAAAVAKLGALLIRPKEQKPLKDHSFRQTNILGKIENTFIIRNPTTNEFLIGQYGALPKEVLETMRKQFDSTKSRQAELPEIRLFRNDFHDEIVKFQDHLEREEDLLRTISPYIEPEYASIFWLGSYAKEAYDQDDRRKADEIKSQVGHQYGSDGRKLCNLYVKGYISDMFQHYLGAIFESARDKSEIGVHLNTLIRRLIRFSEYIFFIHRGSDIDGIASTIRGGVQGGVEFIALHAASVPNIERTEKIIQAVGLDFLEANGYNVIQERPKSTASIPFFDVYVTPGKNGVDRRVDDEGGPPSTVLGRR